MDRRQLFTRLFGFAAAATTLATLPTVNTASAAHVPDATQNPVRALDKAASGIVDGAKDAEWAKKGGKGRGRGRGKAYGRRRKFGY